jgi:hypothetical protein
MWPLIVLFVGLVAVAIGYVVGQWVGRVEGRGALQDELDERERAIAALGGNSCPYPTVKEKQMCPMCKATWVTNNACQEGKRYAECRWPHGTHLHQRCAGDNAGYNGCRFEWIVVAEES